MSIEEEIFFKRFPAEKQDQVRGLVEYATLMGLSGKDLVSIGGKLDRLKSGAERERNMEIVRSFEMLPIGDDKRWRSSYLQDHLDQRFKIKTVGGAYNFDYSYSTWSVKSLKTGVTVSHRVDGWAYELASSLAWTRRNRYAMILDIAHGKFQLNF